MQAIEKSISICDNKKYDYISASDQGFKNCMDMTAFAYETCSGDSSIYKSVCNNAIIEGILKTTNPSVQDLNDKAYKEAEVVLGHSTGNITTTNTQLKTYTDPLGFFTLQYPADWIVEYKQPATKFDTPKVTFITDHPILSIQISVKPSLVNTPEEFKDIISSMASGMTNLNPAWIIIDQGFGIYSIAGYDTYAFIYKDSNIQDPTSPLKGIMFVTRIGYQEMTILFATDPESFDQQMPILQKITDSIKITGR